VQLADALRFIHSRGLVHGDVKAGNVFIGGGVAKLGDFSSLVRLITLSSRSPMSYTPGWRAPEQVYSDLRREARRLGLENRIDVYQLGNLLLYLSAGTLLDGEDAVDEEAVRDAVEAVEHEGLRRVIAGLMAPRPHDRPSSEEAVRMLWGLYSELAPPQE
jgi:serine/threonine protein kinase